MFGAQINQQQQSDPRSDRCGKIILAWILVTGIIILLFIFCSHLSASLITFLIVLFTISFTVYYYYSPTLEIDSVEELCTSQTGLSPSQIKEIPSYAYQWKHQDLKNSNGCDTADFTCAVCIATVQDGVMVRQLPVCMHVFHMNCIDTWLSSHSTCPMCRADVQTGKLYPEKREPPV